MCVRLGFSRYRWILTQVWISVNGPPKYLFCACLCVWFMLHCQSVQSLLRPLTRWPLEWPEPPKQPWTEWKCYRKWVSGWIWSLTIKQKKHKKYIYNFSFIYLLYSSKNITEFWCLSLATESVNMKFKRSHNSQCQLINSVFKENTNATSFTFHWCQQALFKIFFMDLSINQSDNCFSDIKWLKEVLPKCQYISGNIYPNEIFFIQWKQLQVRNLLNMKALPGIK